MPLDIPGARHSRSAAKGNVTKVATQITRMKGLKHTALDEEAVGKQLHALSRANEHFITAHEFLTKEDPEAIEATMVQDLLDHTATATAHRRSLENFLAIIQASELIEAMEDALQVMEVSASQPYYPGREQEIARTEKAVEYFRDARMKPGAREDADLKALRDNAAIRLSAIKASFHKSLPPPPPPLILSTDAIPTRSASNSYDAKPPKLEFPTFHGQISHYVDWRTLFTSLLKKAPRLSEEEKRIHLLRAMGTGTPHEAAVLALGSSSTYAGAMQKLDETFYKKRLIYATHLAELLRPDSVHYVSSDLKRMGDRMELHLRGLQRSIADYTADQILAVLLENNLSPEVKPHWRKHSKDTQVAPTCQLLLEFIREHQEYSEMPAIMSSFSPYEMTPAVPPATPVQTRPRQAPKQPAPRQTAKGPYSADKCAYCVGDHTIFSCVVFQQMSPMQRRDWVKTIGACFNCLSHGHRVLDCRSKFHCRECPERHHSLLHDSTTSLPDSPPSPHLHEPPTIGTANILVQPGFNPR